MDRLQIYTTRTLVAVEFAASPSSLAGLGGRAHTFRRLDLAETKALHAAAVKAASPRDAEHMKHLMAVVGDRVSYWEKRVPPGLQCFVHHVRFPDEAAGKAGYTKAVASFPQSAMLGLYAIDPVISFFPEAFPVDPAPNFWQLGKTNTLSKDNLFFLNFFPPQPFLREQVVQGTTSIYAESTPGLYHTNNYVDLVDDLFITAGNVDKVVSVNLNRYSDGYGFFMAVAGGAAMSVIAEDGHDTFQWHGILCHLVNGAQS
jgi:hypothetical protein